jgi:hypothetical protein
LSSQIWIDQKTSESQTIRPQHHEIAAGHKRSRLRLVLAHLSLAIKFHLSHPFGMALEIFFTLCGSLLLPVLDTRPKRSTLSR